MQPKNVPDQAISSLQAGKAVGDNGIYNRPVVNQSS
jgi:hypothetical protein